MKWAEIVSPTLTHQFKTNPFLWMLWYLCSLSNYGYVLMSFHYTLNNTGAVLEVKKNHKLFANMSVIHFKVLHAAVHSLDIHFEADVVSSI